MYILKTYRNVPGTEFLYYFLKILISVTSSGLQNMALEQKQLPFEEHNVNRNGF